MRVIADKKSGAVGTQTHAGQAQQVPLARPNLPLAPVRHKGSRWWALVMLPLVALAVLLSGDLSRLAVSVTHRQPFRVPVNVAMVNLPLNTMQVDQLSHLANFMPYKQLASNYVSRMTLDEKLGQLFMVQSYDQFYSPSLEYM